MPAKWKLLLKVQLIGLLNINKARKSDDPKEKRKTTGAIILLSFVGLIFLFYVVLMALAFCSQGLGDKLPAMIVSLSSLIVFIFTLFQGGAMLFGTKDYDIVAALPVSKRAVVFSRVLCSYLVNLAFVLLIALPATVVQFIYGGFFLWKLGAIALGVLVCPILPIAVGASLSAALSALTAGMRYKSLIQSLLMVLLFVGIMILSFSFSFSANSETGADMGALYTMLVRKIYLPAIFVQMTLEEGIVWGIFVFTAISLAAGILFVLCISVFYEKINTALRNRGARRAYKSKDIRETSAFSALVKKEFKRLFSSPAYLLNGITGSILLVIAAVALLFFDLNDLGIPTEQVQEISRTFGYIGVGAMALFIGMSCPSAAALSLEGSSRGLLFAMPVSAKNILLSKAMPTFVINCVCGLLFSVLFCIKMRADAVLFILAFATALIFSVFTALGGIFLNYKFPKYDWTNETQAVKNSVPLIIVVFSSMIVGIAAAVLAAFYGVWPILALDLIALALSIAIFCSLKNAKLYV